VARDRDPAPDTIQEFKVQTSLYDAQYGRGAGANVGVETRSGTADFMATPTTSAEMKNWTRIISLRTQPVCQEENSGAPNPVALWVDRCFGQGSTPFSLFRIKAAKDVNAASLSTSVSSLSLPPIPQVRTPASLGAVFGGETGAFGGAAVASDGSNTNPVALNLLNAKNPMERL